MVEDHDMLAGQLESAIREGIKKWEKCRNWKMSKIRGLFSFSLVEKEGSILNFMGFSFFCIHQHRCLFFTTFLYNTLHLTKCFRLRPLVDRQHFTSELVLCCLYSMFYSATVYYAIKGRFVLWACSWIL